MTAFWAYCILMHSVRYVVLVMCFLKCVLTGSYTDSPGIEIIRRHVAQYIERRDGFPSNWENIILSAGASDAIKVVWLMNSV
jgi:aspartate/methionine/tyrosine aminotransferase